MDDFLPRTGAYWYGWLEGIEGNPRQPPGHYDEQETADFNRGYNAGVEQRARENEQTEAENAR